MSTNYKDGTIENDGFSQTLQNKSGTIALTSDIDGQTVGSDISSTAGIAKIISDYEGSTPDSCTQYDSYSSGGRCGSYIEYRRRYNHRISTSAGGSVSSSTTLASAIKTLVTNNHRHSTSSTCYCNTVCSCNCDKNDNGE